MKIISRTLHEWVGMNPATGKAVDLKCWLYTFETWSTEQKVIAYSYDTYDVGTPIIAWIEIKREKDENHVPRSFNICPRFQELRGGIITDAIHMRDKSFEQPIIGIKKNLH